MSPYLLNSFIASSYFLAWASQRSIKHFRPQEWKDCKEFIKEEIYNGLTLNPGEPGVGDWWLKYSWGLKCFIERCEAHAKKYDEAIKELSK